MPRFALKLAAVLTCALMVAGCAVVPSHVLQTDAGRASFERGDYERAVAEARVALLARPDYEPAQALLAQAFRRSVEAHLGRIAEAHRVLDWDGVVAEYRSLFEVERLARPLFFGSASRFGVSDLLVDRTDEYERALGLAAETHYQAGVVLGAEPDRASKRQAARELERAESYISPYKDAAARGALAREAGTETVALLPFEEPGGTGAADRVFEAVRDEFESGSRRFPFVRFVSGGAGLADQIVRGRLESVATEISPILDVRVHTRMRTWEDASGKVHRLRAETRERSRTTRVRMTLDLQVMDRATGREIRGGTLSADAEETRIWREEEDIADDEARLGRAIGDLLGSLLTGERSGPGIADSRTLTREAADELAGKVRSWLAEYCESL